MLYKRTTQPTNAQIKDTEQACDTAAGSDEYTSYMATACRADCWKQASKMI
jgi:hypothetical protein